MRGRRGRCKANELVEAREKERREVCRDSEEEADELEAAKGFFACYLLCSLSPRHKGRTYIGFTVNPQRRIKQHNGQKSCGAWRTKRGRPWEMALCIYGFPSNISALQFEWAWQHPKESLAVRKAASCFKSLSGTANKIKLAYAMLTLPCWENLNLTVNFFSTKYMKHIAGCPRLPNQMRASICSMDDLPCYAEGETLHSCNFDEEEDDGEASLMDRNMSASVDFTIERMNQNSDRMESSSQFWEPTHYNSESSKPCEECLGSLSHSSRLLLELDDLECMRASTSFTASSCSEEYDSMEKFEMPTNQSTPRSSSNETTMNVSPEASVIDLCTPSSNIIRSKTKRALFDSDIIDLTDSPMVIHL